MGTWLMALAAVAITSPATGTPDPLARVVDVEFRAAGLPEAVRALNNATGLKVRVDAVMPDHRVVSFAAKGISARDALDAVAALYGARWARRQDTISITFDPLRRRVSLDLPDSDPAVSLKALRAWLGLRGEPGPLTSGRRVMLQIKDLPAEDALAALAVLCRPAPQAAAPSDRATPNPPEPLRR